MCPICVYADEHGSWPTTHKGTHCADTMERHALNPGCHRSWTAARQEHCVCHLHFAGTQAGDLHRVNGKCLSLEELLSQEPTKSGRRFYQDDSGVLHFGDPEAQFPTRALRGEMRATEPSSLAVEGL